MSNDRKVLMNEGRSYQFDAARVPEHTLNAIVGYVCDKTPPSGFLNAVLSNNLREAFCRADSDNSRCMGAIVGFLYSHCPSSCWGSPDAVMKWLSDE